MVLDEKSAEKLYGRLSLEKSDGDAYKIAFENENGTLKDVLWRLMHILESLVRNS